MACQSCKDKTNGICKVCALLDEDLTIKKVGYCEFCKVMICESCEIDIERRFKAFAKSKAGKLKEQWNKLLESWKT